MRPGTAVIAASLALVPTPSLAAPFLEAEVTSDLRERGLSASAGRAALTARGGVDLAGGVGASVRGTTLRGSARHGGAHFGLDAALRYRRDAGAWQISAGVTRRFYTGDIRLDYWEMDAGASHALGPLRLGLWANYAPDQHAIGGDNLYLEATVEAGLPGTPITLYGGGGLSTGRADDPLRSARLRPDGRYVDYRIGAEYVAGFVAAGLHLSGTDIGAVDRVSPFIDRNRGTRIAGYVRLAL